MAHQGRRSADDTVVGLLASGATIRDTATQAGVSERTIFRRLQDPAFAAMVKRARAAMFEQACGRLADSLGRAITTLHELLASSSEVVRLRAAATLLQQACSLRDSVILSDELEEIKATLAELENRRRKENQ